MKIDSMDFFFSSLITTFSIAPHMKNFEMYHLNRLELHTLNDILQAKKYYSIIQKASSWGGLLKLLL